MAHQHTTTCASCFTEIEYGAICNCTDFNEVNDQYKDTLDQYEDTLDEFDDDLLLDDETLEEHYDRYDY